MGDGAGIWDGVYWGVARVRMYERRRREGTGAGRFLGGVRHNEKNAVHPADVRRFVRGFECYSDSLCFSTCGKRGF